MLAAGFVGRLKAKGVEVVAPVGSMQDTLELTSARPPFDAALLDASLDEGWTSPVAAGLDRLGVPLVLVGDQDAWNTRWMRRASCRAAGDREAHRDRLLRGRGWLQIVLARCRWF